MTISFTKTFLNYRAADAWIEAHGYDGPIMNINEATGVTVVLLEGAMAQKAIEDAATVKVVAQEVRT
jgi:hypothetical protein